MQLYNLIYHRSGDPPRTFTFDNYTEAAAAFARMDNTLARTCTHYRTSIDSSCSQAIFLKDGLTRVITLCEAHMGMTQTDWDNLALD